MERQLDSILQGQVPVSNTSSPPLSPQKGGIPLPRPQSETPPIVGSASSSLNNPSLLSTLASATDVTAGKTLTDKEREKLLYPSRVMLTSTYTPLLTPHFRSKSCQPTLISMASNRTRLTGVRRIQQPVVLSYAHVCPRRSSSVTPLARIPARTPSIAPLR